MMQRFWFALGLSLISLPVAAAEPGPNLQIPAGGTLRGSFTEQHSIKNSATPLQSAGHFVVAPGQGVIWNVEKPLPITVIVTPAGLTQKIGTMRLPSISASRMPILSRATQMLSDALMGHWQSLENDFTITRTVTTTGWEAVLTARANGSVPVQSITVDGADYVNAANAIRPDGGTETFTFSDQSVSATPPTSAELAAFVEANTP